MEEGTIAEKLSKALDSLVPIILRAQEYAVLFSSHSGSSTAGVFLALQEDLTYLYAEVLNFLVRATIFFKKKTIGQFEKRCHCIKHADSSEERRLFAGLSPFDTQFKGILDQVGKLEKNVGLDVVLLNSEGEAYTYNLSMG